MNLEGNFLNVNLSPSTTKTTECSFDLFFLSILYKYKKCARGIRPCRCSPSPQGVKHTVITQDTSSSLYMCSERRDEYLFSRAKSGGLGQVTTTKKRVLLDPVLTAGNNVNSLNMKNAKLVTPTPANNQFAP